MQLPTFIFPYFTWSFFLFFVGLLDTSLIILFIKLLIKIPLLHHYLRASEARLSPTHRSSGASVFVRPVLRARAGLKWCSRSHYFDFVSKIASKYCLKSSSTEKNLKVITLYWV